MSKRSPIVAELGRPETPEETAARKAEFSKAYRSSQTVRGLIAALLATLAIVVVIVLAVPRGEPATERKIDVTGIAADVESSLGSPVIVPELDDFWRVNAAGLTSGATPVWDVTLAPAAENERGFIKLAQAFGVDSSWAPQRLNGVAPTDTTSIGGIEWDVYSLGDAGAEQNVTYAIGTQAGEDYVLLYGSRSAESTADLAETLVPQIRDLSE
ncbi:DUF4245 family protein [Microbacterium hydrocarbonoxydans]|uniref:DUF4245 family protein n=1 Tax=Microbacterium hydrocarbonoxydans TaxID=273678 RepID=UPI00203FEDB1|nr:DUF4245 family protein [Microbacterium hydrocarbonoxydans]MCM3779428.1 DUF4245 domain-containing protein [Microbacterium hydrocarbonoxydans]